MAARKKSGDGPKKPRKARSKSPRKAARKQARKTRASRADRPRRSRGKPAEPEQTERVEAENGRVANATIRARKFARQARVARDASVARVRVLGHQARELGSQARDSVVAASLPPLLQPHLCFVQSPRRPIPVVIMPERVRVATYNVHRWQGANGRAQPDVARAGYVISELEADVIALQEVLRPFALGDQPAADDPLGQLCDELDLHLAFAVTRRHRRGQLGNAILSRYPITAISVLDISYSRIERRGALAARIGTSEAGLGVVATHLSLVDRTRNRQVQSLLEHPAMNAGPAVLMGDMNAWRKCKGSVALDESLGLHHNLDWPASFPAGRPLLALDRIYTQNAQVVSISEHDSPAARKASDHLPVVAEVETKEVEQTADGDRADGMRADASS